MTRSAAKNLLHIPTNRTDRYSKKSAKYNCILDWNKFKQDFYGVNQDELSHFKLKILMRDHILHKYWKIYETFVSSNSTYILCSVYFTLSFSFFFFLFPSFLLRFCIFSLRYLFFFKFIYYTIKQLTPYNLYKKFYSTLVTPFRLKHVLKYRLGLDSSSFSIKFYRKKTWNMFITIYV